MDTEFPISQIMQRYEVHANKELLYSYEELRRLNIDQQFIYALLQTFEDEKEFDAESFRKFSLDVIIDYLCRTHRYYMGARLPEIEQSIQILLDDYDDGHPLLHILNKFFAEYTSSLATHIRAEERHLLPYIKELILLQQDPVKAKDHFTGPGNYTLKEFIDSHQDTEKDLSDVRKVIQEYNPPVSNQTPYRILITQLHAFERDLMIHALIEDKVLIPRSLELEAVLNQKYG